MSVTEQTDFKPWDWWGEQKLQNEEASADLPQKPQNEEAPADLPQKPQNEEAPADLPQKPWNERALTCLEGLNESLDQKLPENRVQKFFNECYAKTLQPLVEAQVIRDINASIDRTDYGVRSKNIAMFILKIPVRAVRNILSLAYRATQLASYILLHPMKACVGALKLLVRIAHALTKPETYTKMGAGILGSAAGQALVLPGFQVLILLVLGCSLIGVGLLAGAISSAVKAESGNKWKAVLNQLGEQIKAMPEAALTGFIMGLIFGGIQSSLRQPTYPMPSKAAADKFLQEYLRDHGVNNLTPSNYYIYVGSKGEIGVQFYKTWWGDPLQANLAPLNCALTGDAHRVVNMLYFRAPGTLSPSGGMWATARDWGQIRPEMVTEYPYVLQPVINGNLSGVAAAALATKV